jgi:Ca-activated chloride channel family protein
MLRSAALILALLASPAQACKVALALTIDVSGSISPAEYRLQMNGLASALEDPTVADALIAAKAHVTTIHWSGASRQMVTIPWVEITAQADVDALASSVRTIERPWRNFSTAIGQMLEITGPLFNDRPCERFVIDVSGDGVSNEGNAPDTIRDHLVARGIQINALAILGESSDDLPSYFRTHVIGGAGAFVYVAESFDDYPRAIRRKLLDEISEPVS